jgi:hypothetical protein
MDVTLVIWQCELAEKKNQLSNLTKQLIFHKDVKWGEP